MKRFKRYLKIISFLIVFIIGFLLVYSYGPYEADATMEDFILVSNNITIDEDFDEISYQVLDPIGNIIIIPGGKVKAEAYKYMANSLALEGYNVTIYKPILNLSILAGNYPKRFLDDNLDNIVIGHSLGGVTASNLASKVEVDTVVLLGSYSTKDISDTNVLSIIAENDLVINQSNYDENKDNLGNYTENTVIGGNHSQFGFYSNQNKDGEATISIKEQQDVIVGFITFYLNNLD